MDSSALKENTFIIGSRIAVCTGGSLAASIFPAAGSVPPRMESNVPRRDVKRV